MKKYRIIEKKFDDGRSEFFPEHYNEKYKEVVGLLCSDGWFSIAETYMKVLKKGYSSMKTAKFRIKMHKINKTGDGKKIVEEKTHYVD